MTSIVVGISGKSFSGKDTIADVLVHEFGFLKVAFADKVKRVIRDIYGLTHDQLWGDRKDVIIPELGCTSRQLMKELGTDWVRRRAPNTWIRHVDLAIAFAAHGYGYNRIEGTIGKRTAFKKTRFVVPDIRYVDEFEAPFFTYRVRVLRGEPAPARVTVTSYAHSSETEQDSIPDSRFDRVLKNDSTLEAIQEQARRIGRELTEKSQ